MDKKVRAARADLAKIERQYGSAAADHAGQRRPSMRALKLNHSRLTTQLRTARARLARLTKFRRNVPKLVEVRDLDQQTVVRLATEVIKMVAYHSESDLLALLQPHYLRAEQEGRTRLHELFAAAGRIRISDRELAITLAPSARRIELAPPRPSATSSTNRCHLPELPPQDALRRTSPSANRTRLPSITKPTRYPSPIPPRSCALTGHSRRALCQEF